jgi:hypothetical protein
MSKPGLYDNMNRRKKLGIARSAKKSTIDPKVYSQMKAKEGGFKEKKKEKV